MLTLYLYDYKRKFWHNMELILSYLRKNSHMLRETARRWWHWRKEWGLKDPKSLVFHIKMYIKTPSWASYSEVKKKIIIIISCQIQQELTPLNAELNPICHLLALLGVHHFLHVSRIRVKSLTLRLLMSYIYGAPILDVSRSHTTTHHSR